MERKSPGFLRQFRDFAVRGNVVDLAVGIIIDAAPTASSKAETLLDSIRGILDRRLGAGERAPAVIR